MVKDIAYIGLALMFITSLIGCNSTGCTENKNSVPLAGFYAYSTKQAITVDSISIGGVGAPNDSLIIDCASASSVYLPFRASMHEVRYFIRYEAKALNYPELVDTITFTYTSIPYFASEDCGAMYRYDITDFRYTTNLIDSVAVTDKLITNVDIERIKIFFRTADTEQGE